MKLPITLVCVAGVTLAGCGGKLSADETEAKLTQSTNAQSVRCQKAEGQLSDWDYQCLVDYGDYRTLLGVNVDGDGITEQTER
jgi:hypothetical protein